MPTLPSIKQWQSEAIASLSQWHSPTEARAMVQWLLQDFMGLQAHELALAGQQPISDAIYRQLQEVMAELLKGRPLQYVLGYAWFYDRKFQVNEHVLIPRQETEELVHRVIQALAGTKACLLDVGTGSGCMAVSLAGELPQSQVWATDISHKALHVASENARAHGVKVHFMEHDMRQPLPARVPALDALVSNPPYVREQEKPHMHRQVWEHEPAQALFVPDNDPLLFYSALARLGHRAVKPGGWIWAEINDHLGKETRQLFMQQGYTQVRIVHDINNKPRMLEARKNT